MSDESKKLSPNLDEKTTKVLNLTVLQRMDPFINQILFIAAHVSFYDFNLQTNQWSRKDVEGSLFVVKRNSQPRFQFIVMNRRNTENLVENLLDFEYELKKPYLLYRNAAQDVNGIWFYDPDECEEVANLFNRILSAYPKVPSTTTMPSNKSVFEELEPVSVITESPLHLSQSSKDAHEDPLFPNFFSTSKVTEQYASIETINSGNQVNNLPKPSTYFSSTSSSSVLIPPISSHPMLQPFPPPNPSLSLAPISNSTSSKPVITRDKVRDALVSLFQVDITY
ncbi:hypothetical protein TanjilG_02562 [Lupinus angustifolius]|uniref:WH1 domain-containing protein n=1 Tax=Lupinus angustifolius TaxID=3871 RepID=A0A394DE29_LUPAN|nr:hypothetical protein TanjilG_02562 [Lupinus angustifolius]